MARVRKGSKAISAVAERFAAFRHAREVLSVVRAVPTRFIQLDHALRVGGWPIERFTMVHGESGEGKTLATLGLVDSFLSLNHFVLHVDAERTTPFPWVRTLMGAMAEHERFFASRPDTYEDTIAEVQNFLNAVTEAKRAGDVPPETSALVVVDSFRKLVPADLMKEILAADAEGGDMIKTGRDRRAQLQAKMNAAWMDMLVPLLEKAGAAFVAIAREMKDPDADMWAKRTGTDYKVGGGGAIYYDSSVVARVERAAWVSEGEGKERRVYGERHRVTIRKSKVAGKDDKVAVAYFHSSNGQLVPEGFDRARDVLELARKFAVVKQAGSSFSFHARRIGQGEHNVVKRLTADAELLRELEAEVREQFAEHEPVEHDEDGVVVDNPMDKARAKAGLT